VRRVERSAPASSRVLRAGSSGFQRAA
jgi:hypothetical protein